MINNTKPTVALIWGGQGYEKEVSRRGIENILPLINKATYEVISVHIEPDGRWTLDGKDILLAKGGIITAGGFRFVDCAFPLLHGDFGEDGRVQGALDCAGISYVGCDCMTSGICRDKLIVKAVAKSLGIKALPATLVLRRDGIQSALKEAEEIIGYPLFVKPCSLGSSIGASPARNREELILALDAAFALADRVMVERLLSQKRELECGFLSVKGKELFTNPGEIICESFYDYNRKYGVNCASAVACAELRQDIKDRIKDHSKSLVRRLGVRDLARIDYFLSGDEIYFNEINTMPGQTESSLYSKMLAAEGISSYDFVNLLVEEAILRAEDKTTYFNRSDFSS